MQIPRFAKGLHVFYL